MVQPTCTLESDFGFSINCAFKKSGLFRVRNLGGVKAHVGWGNLSTSPSFHLPFSFFHITLIVLTLYISRIENIDLHVYLYKFQCFKIDALLRIIEKELRPTSDFKEKRFVCLFVLNRLQIYGTELRNSFTIGILHCP